MQRESLNRFTIRGKAALAGLLIAWVLAAALISSDHHLHELIHHDSAQANHHCAISIFERGQTLTGDSLYTIELCQNELVSAAELNRSEHFSSFQFRKNSTRAPPVDSFQPVRPGQIV